MYIHDTTFQVFCALEEEVRSSLHTLVLEPTRTHKDKLISQLLSSEDIQFYWCIVDLFVIVCGFAFASARIEKHKQSEKKSTQRSKKGYVHVRRFTATKGHLELLTIYYILNSHNYSYHSFLLYYIYYCMHLLDYNLI